MVFPIKGYIFINRVFNKYFCKLVLRFLFNIYNFSIIIECIMINIRILQT